MFTSVCQCVFRAPQALLGTQTYSQKNTQTHKTSLLHIHMCSHHTDIHTNTYSHRGPTGTHANIFTLPQMIPEHRDRVQHRQIQPHVHREKRACILTHTNCIMAGVHGCSVFAHLQAQIEVAKNVRVRTHTQVVLHSVHLPLSPGPCATLANITTRPCLSHFSLVSSWTLEWLSKIQHVFFCHFFLSEGRLVFVGGL